MVLILRPKLREILCVPRVFLLFYSRFAIMQSSNSHNCNSKEGRAGRWCSGNPIGVTVRGSWVEGWVKKKDGREEGEGDSGGLDRLSRAWSLC